MRWAWLLLMLAAAVTAGRLHPVLAAGPLLLALPAVLLLWDSRGGRDPYDVSARYGGTTPSGGEGDAPQESSLA